LITEPLNGPFTRSSLSRLRRCSVDRRHYPDVPGEAVMV
jgi:hypothetical protein